MTNYIVRLFPNHRTHTNRLLAEFAQRTFDFYGFLVRDEQNKSDTKIERAAHIVFRHHAGFLNQLEDGRPLPCMPIDREIEPFVQHA